MRTDCPAQQSPAVFAARRASQTRLAGSTTFHPRLAILEMAAGRRELSPRSGSGGALRTTIPTSLRSSLHIPAASEWQHQHRSQLFGPHPAPDLPAALIPISGSWTPIDRTSDGRNPDLETDAFHRCLRSLFTHRAAGAASASHSSTIASARTFFAFHRTMNGGNDRRHNDGERWHERATRLYQALLADRSMKTGAYRSATFSMQRWIPQQ